MQIVGKVQNVWYRASTAGVARDLGLKGFARNLENGSVKIVAVGEKVNLDKLKKWCELGPTGAMVEKIEEKWSEVEKNFTDFEIL